MSNAEIASLGDEALVHKEVKLERDLVSLMFRHRTGQLEDTSQIGKLRKDIARLRTAQRERELVLGLPKDSLRSKHKATAGREEAADAPVQAASKGFLKGIVDKIKGTE